LASAVFSTATSLLAKAKHSHNATLGKFEAARRISDDKRGKCAGSSQDGLRRPCWYYSGQRWLPTCMQLHT